MSQREHWDEIYQKKPTDKVSWYRPHLESSLRFIEQPDLARDAAVIDVGGGASTLVDDLLALGFENVTVLDISATALEAAKQRLGGLAARVHWLVGDITQIALVDRNYDFWHDRAVFHFLREPEARRRYVAAASRALKPTGHLLVATFGPEGPERCSGLPVARYSPESLHAEFGEAFGKLVGLTEVHTTPSGAQQQFVYCYCRLLPR